MPLRRKGTDVSTPRKPPGGYIEPPEAQEAMRELRGLGDSSLVEVVDGVIDALGDNAAVPDLMYRQM